MVSLLVVSGVRDVDTIATVALLLAILSFVMQIVMFIAQAWTGTEVYTRTAELLAEVRKGVQSTEGILNQQFSPLLQAFERTFTQTRKISRDTTSDSAAFRTLLRENLARVQEPAQSPSDSGPSRARSSRSAPEVPPGPTLEDAKIIRHLETFPSPEDGRRLLAIIDGLSPLAAVMLSRYAEDEIESRQTGVAPGLPTEREGGMPFTDELIENGLVEFYATTDGQARKWARLTDLGREVARVLPFDQGPVPDYLKEVAGKRRRST